MTGPRAVLLVARREFSERLRERAFRISTAVTLLIVAGVAVLASVLGGDEPERYEVGAVGAEPTAIARAAERSAPAFDARLEVREVTGEQPARAALRDGELDAVLGPGGRLIVEDDPPAELETLLQASTRELRSAARLRERGLDPAEVERALDPPPLRVVSLDADDGENREGLAFVASMLLYGQVLVYGMWIAMGVVEEKSSRVVELLLAAVPPRALIAGKILGLGLLGLSQLFLAAVVGLAVGAAGGAIEIDVEVIGVLGLVLGWFLLGYALYAGLYAMAGVLVSRQEDMQNTTTPLTLVVVFAFLLVFPALEDPDGVLARVAALVPLSSPIVMPARIAVGEASAPEIVASLALLVGTTAVLVPAVGRVYEGAVLRMGRPAKLLEAWRGSAVSS
jgi:ABC-2 type transport system permease protein